MGVSVCLYTLCQILIVNYCNSFISLFFKNAKEKEYLYTTMRDKLELDPDIAYGILCGAKALNLDYLLGEYFTIVK